MKTLELQLDAPIIPNYSLGGFLLKTPIHELTDILVGLGLWTEGCYELVSPFEARYRLGKGEVELAVDVRNGKLFKLTAYYGYRGRLFEKIAIAMRVQEALEYEPRLFYSEAEGAILCKDVPGLTVDVAEVDPPLELIPDLKISAISVHIPELYTREGILGNW